MSLSHEQRQELDVHIFGSGATDYPWYRGVSVNVAANIIAVEADSPYDFEPETFFTNFDELERAAADLLEENNVRAIGDTGGYTRKGLSDLVARNYDELDIDADVADLIIQRALYGEVVFA